MSKKKAPKKELRPREDVKTWTVTQRFSQREVELLDEYAEIISEVTGVTVKRAWVIRKMLELGQKVLEKEYGIKPK